MSEREPLGVESIWKEIQDTAPPGEVLGPEFYDWTVELAARVEAGEVAAVDALQALKWLILNREQAKRDALDERWNERVRTLAGGPR